MSWVATGTAAIGAVGSIGGGLAGGGGPAGPAISGQVEFGGVNFGNNSKGAPWVLVSAIVAVVTIFLGVALFSRSRDSKS